MDNRVKLLKALADNTRLKIVRFVLDEEKCVCVIVPHVGKSQPAVSQHLRILTEAGVLRSRRKGVNMWYRVKSAKARNILDIIDSKSN